MPHIKYYTDAQRKGLQGWGNSLIDRQVERFGAPLTTDRTLEIGASSGEHLAFVAPNKKASTYICLDTRPGKTDPRLTYELITSGATVFVAGDASKLPFRDETFDRTVSTCVLAHVADPKSTFEELRRVTKTGGSVIVGMPCDPGMLNRFVKMVITFRQMKRAGISNPKFEYAYEHQNGISNLLAIGKHVFRGDSTKIHYFPLHFPTWNFNLISTLESTIKR